MQPREDRLVRGDHRKFLDRGAQRAQSLLHRIRISAPPRVDQRAHRTDVDVRRRRDAADAAEPQCVEEECLAAREYFEIVEAIEHRLGVFPIARAIFDADDRAREILQQALDEIEREAHRCHRRDVIEIDLQPRVGDPLDQLGDSGIEAIIADALVVERRQQQHAHAAVLDCVACQRHRIGQRSAAGAGHQLQRMDAGIDQAIESVHPLQARKRIRFARRTEYGQPVGAFIEKPLAMTDKPLLVNREVGVEWRARGNENAAQGFRFAHFPSPFDIEETLEHNDHHRCSCAFCRAQSQRGHSGPLYRVAPIVFATGVVR